MHALLAADSTAVPGKLTISYRVCRGSKELTLAELNVYEGRLYFPKGNLDATGGNLGTLQAAARTAGMRAGGTWIELPEDEAVRAALLRLVTGELAANH